MFHAMSDEVDQFTPETGFNVVGFDDFNDPGEMLYLIDHAETREEAEDIKARYLAEQEDAVVYIYVADEDEPQSGGSLTS